MTIGVRRNFASSVGVDAELQRAAMRAGQSPDRANDFLERLTLLTTGDRRPATGDRRRELARSVGSPLLRALDAIHLGSALSLGDDLGAFCCYDGRLASDAVAAGLTVLSPGSD